jgi:antitoxin MazE
VAVVRTNLVRIGNSRGVRIPKALIDQVGLRDAVELEVEAGRLVIRPAEHERAGWEAVFEQMAELGDDALPEWGPVGQTDWDRTDWEW